MEVKSKQAKVEADQIALYNLKLHETIRFDTSGPNVITVTRVAGGWLYHLTGGNGATTTFVPYVPNKEF